jgi:EAL domain-containing protein (putative c-di-GMP-specific phosphodiesterase class I)
MAEGTGLIIPIGKRVLSKVCEQLMLWRREGIPLIPISINMSAQQFYQQDFVQEIRQLLSDYQLEGSLLIFEIAETSLMKNEGFTTGTLKELKKLGIKIYTDHFGTGHSSLSYLNSFHLDGIKIDRSFIENISFKYHNAVITSGLLRISRHLGIHVIAEGIETEEELQFLKEQKCPQVQGFLFGKPCSAEEFKPILIKKTLTPIKKGNIYSEKNAYGIKIRYPFQCEMALIEYPGGTLYDETITIEIENIGPGGLRFLSNLKLTIGQEMLYSFRPEESEEIIRVAGAVIWSEDLPDGKYQYGVHFTISQSQRPALTQLLKHYSEIYFSN